MIQEYLLLNEAEKEKIEAFDAKEAALKLTQIKGQNGWSVSFSIKGENEDTARKLSEIDTSFCSQFSVTTLENGCSTYMNRRLYPLVSDFERKLRKLLYITSAVHKDDAASKNISDLESKDFGTIFSMLFIDDDFMTGVKANIKSRQRELFSKADIIAYIESLDENTVWDILLGKDTVPNLRTRFNDVREYRNDVMHSHNISWKKYKDAWKLYTNINKELDTMLSDVIGSVEQPAEESTFNQTLQEVLEAQAKSVDYAELQGRLQEVVSAYSMNPEFEALQQQVREATEAFKISPELLRMQEEWKSIYDSIIPPESYRALSEAAKNIVTIQANISLAMDELKKTISRLAIPKIEIPPALTKLQESLSSFPTLPLHDANESKGTDEADSSSNDDGGKQ